MHTKKIILIWMSAIATPVTFAQASGNLAAQPSAIEVQRTGEQSYQLILRSYRSSTVTAGQAELMPKVAQLCAPRSASLGKYSFELTEPLTKRKDTPGMLVLRQEVACGAATAHSSAGAQTGTAAPTATPEQVRRVEQQTRLYFDAKDQGRYTSAYDLMAASFKQSITFATWRGRAQAFNTKAGAVAQRTIARITWYRNPPQVAPGLYAAVDFTSKFAEVDIHCGFLAWHEQADGKFLLVREEENYLDKPTQRGLRPDEVDRVRQQFRCR